MSNPVESEIVVYYLGDRPNTIYEVFTNSPISENPYCEIAGWWEAKENTNPPEYHYVENAHRRPMLMDKNHLINKLIPDPNAVKCFDTLDDFKNQQFLDAI